MMRRAVAESPILIGGTTLIPVVEILLRHWHDEGRMTFLGWKKPTAVVVISGKVKRALRITGEEIPFDELTQEVEGIEEALDRAGQRRETIYRGGVSGEEESASQET